MFANLNLAVALALPLTYLVGALVLLVTVFTFSERIMLAGFVAIAVIFLGLVAILYRVLQGLAWTTASAAG